MDYVTTIVTEHSTYSTTDPKRTLIRMTRGRLGAGWIYFPSGPAGNLHMALLRAAYQVAPIDPQQGYALDDAVVTLAPGFDLHQPPYQLTILTWNTSTLYDHTLTISLTLDPFFGRPPKRPFLSSLFPSLRKNKVEL